MRHHQTDKADQAGRRDGRADAERRAQHQLKLDALDVEAQVTGLRLAQQHGIECRRATWQPQRHAQGDDQQRPQARIAGAVEAAQVPERQGAQGRVIGQVGEQTHAGTGHGRHRHTRQQQGGNVGLPVAAAEAIHHRRDDQATGEGADRQQVRLYRWRHATQQAAADDGEGGTQRGTAGDADQARVRQGVAEQPLHRHAGQRQYRAHGDAEQAARQADLTEDQLRLLRVTPVKRQPQQAHPGQQGIAQRQAHRPEGQGQPEHQHQQQQQTDQGRTRPENGRHGWVPAVCALTSG
ncbi:hypothetical protein D3C76_408860 [compost metagenome]